MPKITSLDHLVITVTDIPKSVAFYCKILGMIGEEFVPADGSARWALKFGTQKINLHQAGQEFKPNASKAGIGTQDLCFLTDAPLVDWIEHLNMNDVVIEEGPIARTGATGPLQSIYIRDLDDNLIEISNYV